MATIVTISGTHTPNEGRIIINDNFTALNVELTSNTSTLSGVVGNIVGTTQTQTLTNKTLVSTNRGGTNTFSLSRKDLESTSLFTVVSDNGSVSNIDITQTSVYELNVLGSDGLNTYVTSNQLYIDTNEEFILNKTNQVFGVGVSSVTTGCSAEFENSVKINTKLGVGAELTAVPSTVLHIKDSNPTFRLESTSNSSIISLTDNTNNHQFTSNFSTNYLELRMNGTRVINFTPTAITLDQNTTFSGSSNTFSGNLIVTGTLTAGVLSAVATDVVINNGPVTISGGQSFIADGAIDIDKLAVTTAGQFIVGGLSGIPQATTISGDIQSSGTNIGELTIKSGVISMSKFASQSANTILGGTGSGVNTLIANVNSDISFLTSGSDITFNIKTGKITNTHISASANIDITKTSLSVDADKGFTYISGIISSNYDLDAVNPVGSIIAYAGDVGTSSNSLQEPIPGWLLCNGAALPISYSALRTVLGTTWGGSYNLPDLRGQFLRGLAFNATQDPGFASRSSSGVGSSQGDNTGSHKHYIANTDEEDPLSPDWDPTLNSNESLTWGTTGTFTPFDEKYSLTGTSTVPTVGKTSNPFDQDDVETRPKNVYVAYLIKY